MANCHVITQDSRFLNNAFFTVGEVPPDRRYLKPFRLVCCGGGRERDELQNGDTSPTPEGPEES
jgi:hypothetical protein